VQTPPPKESAGPFILAIVLGGLFGATALTFACFVGVAMLFTFLFHFDNVIPSLVLTEFLSIVGFVGGIVMAIKRPGNVAAGAAIGVSAGLFAGSALTLCVIITLNHGNLS
jgi:hypothetical protein